jgi:hypothetical protein
MITNLTQFKLDLKHFSEVVVPAEFNGYMKRIALHLYDDITDGMSGGPGNPKDTGWSRANWGVKVGRTGVPTEPMGTYDESKSGQGTPIPRTAYMDVHNIVSMAVLGPSPFLWLYNNAPYIEALEDGHSKKAATGFVEHALNNLKIYVDNI